MKYCLYFLSFPRNLRGFIRGNNAEISESPRAYAPWLLEGAKLFIKRNNLPAILLSLALNILFDYLLVDTDS